MRLERKNWVEEEERRAGGREFQTVGAAKRKERRDCEDFKKGTVRRCWSEERRERGEDKGLEESEDRWVVDCGEFCK